MNSPNGVRTTRPLAARLSDNGKRNLFLLTLVTGSFLLFLIQPMIARMALPRLGGAPAVWNSAMLVYQALLLGGYAYAHAIGRLTPQRQAVVHLSLLAVAALWLPVGLSSAVPEPGDDPIVWVPWLLISSIGPLFFIVAAQAPLMQRWYGLTSRADPYPLYAASNLGSFAGLVSYPLLVEPGLALGAQSGLWSGLFSGLVVLVAVCGMALPRAAASAERMAVTPKPTARRIAYWIALAAVPSGLMLSTTSHLTTDVVAVPLLWVVPLGLYLLSFTVAFAANRRVADVVTLIAPVLILSLGGLVFSDASRHPAVWGLAGLLLLFVVACALHAELYRTRPAPDHLTGFYLAMSVGGVLGGGFCALVAPAIFDWTYEHPLLILGAAALVPLYQPIPGMERLWSGPDHRLKLMLFVLCVVLLAVVAAMPVLETSLWGIAAQAGLVIAAVIGIGWRPAYLTSLVGLMLGLGGFTALATSGERTRSYFGVYEVQTRAGGRTRALTNGTTLHGLQLLGHGRERTATSYYAPHSGVGLPLVHADALFGPGASIGVVGLGAGTLACYKRPGQNWTFYEIDPVMARIARDPANFTFLSRCAPDAAIRIGDARLTLGTEPLAVHDLLALDAFSSDAVPMHLLTAEAFAGYARVLAPGGLLVVHISNRYLDLEPLLAAIAREGGWTAALRDHVPDADEQLDRSTRSLWVAMARDPATIARLRAVSGTDEWTPLRTRAGFRAWTDDYATILPLIEIPK